MLYNDVIMTSCNDVTHYGVLALSQKVVEPIRKEVLESKHTFYSTDLFDIFCIVLFNIWLPKKAIALHL